MDAGVVTTIIVEAATIIGLLIKQSGERKQNAIEQARRDQAIADELKDIRKDQARMEKKIDEHNGYAKMFSVVIVSSFALIIIILLYQNYGKI